MNRDFWVRVVASFACLVLVFFLQPFWVADWFWVAVFRVVVLVCLLVVVWFFVPLFLREWRSRRLGFGGSRLSDVELRRLAWFEFERDSVLYLRSSGWVLELLLLEWKGFAFCQLKKPGLRSLVKSVSLFEDGVYGSLSGTDSLERFQRVDSVVGFLDDRKRFLKVEDKIERIEKGDLE